MVAQLYFTAMASRTRSCTTTCPRVQGCKQPKAFDLCLSHLHQANAKTHQPGRDKPKLEVAFVRNDREPVLKGTVQVLGFGGEGGSHSSPDFMQHRPLESHSNTNKESQRTRPGPKPHSGIPGA